jgi:hypothetical protein
MSLQPVPPPRYALALCAIYGQPPSRSTGLCLLDQPGINRVRLVRHPRIEPASGGAGQELCAASLVARHLLRPGWSSHPDPGLGWFGYLAHAAFKPDLALNRISDGADISPQMRRPESALPRELRRLLTWACWKRVILYRTASMFSAHR